MKNLRTRKFPNGGYDVTVVAKDDILETINDNITDREIMDDLITQLELDVSKYIKEERWTGVPFLGSIRIPPVRIISKKYKEEKAIAFETLPKKEYIMFISQSALDNDKIVRANRLYKYITSKAVTSNAKLFRKIAKEKGDVYARLYMYFKAMITAVNNEFEFIEDGVD